MKKDCSTCGGTGQVSFFQGVSRFLLTVEECPQCNGTGQIDEEKGEPDKKKSRKNTKGGRKKKKS